jgi:hypothetical protein
MRRLVVLLALALASGTLAPRTASSAGAWLLAPGEYSSDFVFSRTGTWQFFDDDGEKFPTAQSVVDERRTALSVNELGWKPWITVGIGVPLVSNSLRNTATREHRTQTGLGDLRVGARFKLFSGASSAVALETVWKIPMGYDREVTPRLGDALHHLSGDLAIGGSFPAIQTFVQASVGYLARFEVRLNPTKESRHLEGDAITHSADVGVWIGNSLLVAGRYQGFSAGAGEDSLERNAYTAGPELRYRVDDRLDVFAGTRYDIAGRNVGAGTQYYGGIAVKQSQLHRLQGFLGSARRP